MKKQQTEVLIIGAGPAGLAAAIELKKLGVSKVLVTERDGVAGGMPRFCHHTGFGVMDLHRLYTGPGYAQAYVNQALARQVEIRTQSTVIDWADVTTCVTTSPAGLAEIQADAILLATGCRERPRAARLVPGTRPMGIFTTGALQDFVHHLSSRVGKKAVIVGAEPVSLSALLTLAKARCRVVALLTTYAQHQFTGIYQPAKIALADLLYRAPVETNCSVQQILGQDRVEGIQVKNTRNGQVRTIPCDVVVFTGDWIPDHELARRNGVAIDASTLGPAVDTRLQTSVPTIFAAGNLLHGVETSAVAAEEGIWAAKSIHDYLTGSLVAGHRLPIIAEAPVHWTTPSFICPQNSQSLPALFRFRVQKFCKQAQVRIHQGSTLLHEQWFRSCVPNVSYLMNRNWVEKASPSGDAIRISLTD